MPVTWSEVDEPDRRANGGLEDLVAGKPLQPVEPERGMWQRLKDSYNEAVQYGFPGLAARKIHDWVDTGKDELRRRNPNLNEDQLEAMQEQMVNMAQRDLRDQYTAQRDKDPTWRPDESWIDNIASTRWAPFIAGQVAGSAGPENLIMPGSSVGQRILGQAAISGGTDLGYQGLDVLDNVADKVDPKQVLMATAVGGGFQGVVEAIGKMVRAGDAAGARALADEYGLTVDIPEGAVGNPNTISRAGEGLEEDLQVITGKPETMDQIIDGPRSIEGQDVRAAHPDDLDQPPMKTPFERGEGMDERQAQQYERQVRAEKAAQIEADAQTAPVDNVVPITDRKMGSIGPGQGIIPEDLQGFPAPARQSIPQEETIARGEALDEVPVIGDVAAAAARGQQEVKKAGTDLLAAYNEYGPGSDQYAESFQKWLVDTARHSENSGNIGRGLNILNRGGLSNKQAERITELATDPKKADKFAKLIDQYKDDPQALEKIARDAVDPRIRDQIFSFRYNMMLSGPKTHVYNILGNTSNILVDLAEHGGAAILGQRKKLTGDLDRVTGREVAARITGAVVGARQGLAKARQAFREGTTSDGVDRIDMNRARVGAWQLPVKALAAEDEFFRSVAATSDTYGAAVRKAVKEGLSDTPQGSQDAGGALSARIQQLIDNPTEDILESSSEYAKRMRFQDDPGILGRAIENLRTHKKDDTYVQELGRDGLTLVIPFVRTPDSLIRTAVRRSPLGFTDSVNINDWKAGGARRDLAIARTAMGSGVVAGIGLKALDGTITGEGPRDYKKRDALALTGWQPNSIKVGDKYYSYQGLEPLSQLLSGVATTMERWGEGGDSYVSQAATQAVNAADFLTNSTWTESLSDLFSALDAPEGTRQSAVNNFFANIASSFAVPAAVRQVNQSYFDPVSRDTRGDDSFEDKLVGRIQSGIPGLSDDLPAKRDALGREIGAGDAAGPDIISRAAPTMAENSPLAAELDRLMKADPEGNPVVKPVERTLKTKEYTGRLNAQQYSDYQRAFGDHFAAEMEPVIASPEWDITPDDAKVEIIQKTAKAARKAARQQVFSGTDEAGARELFEGVEGTDGSFSSNFAKDLGVRITDDGVRSNDEQRRLAGRYKGVARPGTSAHETGNAIDFAPRRGLTRQDVIDYLKRSGKTGIKIVTKMHGSGPHWHVQWDNDLDMEGVTWQ